MGFRPMVGVQIFTIEITFIADWLHVKFIISR